MTARIRPMTFEDRPAIADILSRTPEFKPFEVIVAQELIDAFLDDPAGSGYSVLVAEADGRAVGYICYGATPLAEGTWDIYWQAVAPERQGQGIGGALMKAAEAGIRKAGGRLAIIETSSTPLYEKTVRFHTGQGFETIGCIPDFYSPGDDKLIMRKRLTGPAPGKPAGGKQVS